MKIFFDTNILLDLTLERVPFYKISERLVLNCIAAGHDKILSSLSIANIHYSVKKSFSLEAAHAGVQKILEHFKISSLNEEIVKQAHHANWKDFEDALQYFSALAAGANLIVTRDVKGYEEQKIKVITPEEALRSLTG